MILTPLPLSQTDTFLDPSLPLERDVLYGRPQDRQEHERQRGEQKARKQTKMSSEAAVSPELAAVFDWTTSVSEVYEDGIN